MGPEPDLKNRVTHQTQSRSQLVSFEKQNPEAKKMAKLIFSHFIDRRSVLFIVATLSLLIFLSFVSFPTIPIFQSFSLADDNHDRANETLIQVNSTSSVHGPAFSGRKSELLRSRLAVCLVGGARRFELTGPSIIKHVLEEYPNSDLFLHSPLDDKAFKLSLLKKAPRIAAVRIFEPKHMAETESEVRVLTASNSPNGIQGLLQYFNLVEGCLKMIQNHQMTQNFTYDWIVRTRVDGYWNAPLDPTNFVPGRYSVPLGSSYGGLNDRLGIGDLNTTTVALSRLSLIPELDAAGYRQLNSESSFRAQLVNRNVSFVTKRLPFCVVSDRRYPFPPGRAGVPVAAVSGRGALSGAKCRPCTAVCEGRCATAVATGLQREWSWIDSSEGTIKLCNATGEWEAGWEGLFDRVAGKKFAGERRRVAGLTFAKCIRDFNEMKRRTTGSWEVPPAEKVCGMGLLKSG